MEWEWSCRKQPARSWFSLERRQPVRVFPGPFSQSQLPANQLLARSRSSRSLDRSVWAIAQSTGSSPTDAGPIERLGKEKLHCRSEFGSARSERKTRNGHARFSAFTDTERERETSAAGLLALANPCCLRRCRRVPHRRPTSQLLSAFRSPLRSPRRWTGRAPPRDRRKIP